MVKPCLEFPDPPHTPYLDKSFFSNRDDPPYFNAILLNFICCVKQDPINNPTDIVPISRNKPHSLH